MEIFIIILLILLNGVFSMSEIALVSSKKFKLENAAKKGNLNARKALKLSESPNTFLSTVQIGITLIGILTGIYSGEKITADVQATISRVAILQPYAETLAITCILIIITFFSIVFGELLPKRLGLLFPETIAAFMAAPMIFVSKIAAPFIWLLSKTNSLVLRILGISEKSQNEVTEEEIKAMLQESTEGGNIQEIEQKIVQRVFALGDRRVSELMTHRSDLVWIDIRDALSTIKEKVKKEAHSIYPVADGNLDNFTGILNLKDLFPKQLHENTFRLEDHITQPMFVHENTPVYKLLEKLKENHTHFSIVVDEYGVVQGVVSIDDVLDALVGNVSENTDDEYQIMSREDGSWLADGQYPYFEFLNFFNISESDEELPEGDFNTLAGLILNILGRIPATGETITWKNLKMEIVDMDGIRIDKVIIQKQAEQNK